MRRLSFLVLLLPTMGLALTYDVVDLGTLPAHSTSVALAISDTGQLAGNSQTFLPHAFVTDGQGGLVDIGDLGGVSPSSTGVDVVDGRVVGSTSTPAGNRAYSWTSAGGIVDLGTLAGYDTSGATAVSASGWVVGALSNIGGPGPATGFRWSGLGPLEALADLDARLGTSAATDVNDDGTVVGWYEVGGDHRAFRLEVGGVAEPLGTLGGAESEALAMSGSQVVGWAHDGTGTRRASRWDGAQMIQLPDVGGDTEAHGVNAAGWIVGLAGPAQGGRPEAALWIGDSYLSVSDLIDPSLGWFLEAAYDINDRGDLAVKGLQGASRGLWLQRVDDALDLNALGVVAAGASTPLEVSGGVPGQLVGLLWGSVGATSIAGICPGVAVEVANVRLAAPLTALDATGVAQFDLGVPAGLAGQTLALQVVAPGSCETSQRIEVAL